MSSIEIVPNLDIFGSVKDNLTRPPKVTGGSKSYKNLTKYRRLCYIQIKYPKLLFQIFSLLEIKDKLSFYDINIFLYDNLLAQG